MHCPRCGQQQVSAEIKYCSRCGFPLSLIAEVLAHGGTLPQLEELGKEKKWFTRKNGVVFSVFWFMFFLFIMTPFWGITGVDELAGISAILGIFGGLMLLVASLVLLKPAAKKFPAQPNHELPYSAPATLHGGRQNALPPQQSISASAYAPPPAGNWRDTNDLTPTSVTESTTKLLKKDE